LSLLFAEISAAKAKIAIFWDSCAGHFIIESKNLLVINNNINIKIEFKNLALNIIIL
jgi:hypothetical protein